MHTYVVYADLSSDSWPLHLVATLYAPPEVVNRDGNTIILTECPPDVFYHIFYNIHFQEVQRSVEK